MSSLSLIFLKVKGPLEANEDSISVHICNLDLFKILTLSSETMASMLDYLYRNYEMTIIFQNKWLSTKIEF